MWLIKQKWNKKIEILPECKSNKRQKSISENIRDSENQFRCYNIQIMVFWGAESGKEL